jgi:hypothetical protein
MSGGRAVGPGLVAAAALAAALAAQTESRPRFAVVAPRAIAPALADFVEYKRATVPTDLLVLEDLLAASEGADDAERLKRALHAAWRDRNVAWVLLGGDADVLPVRYMALDRVTPAAFDVAFYPCDLYYADVARPDGTFDDWNGRKDGFHGRYFGEVRGEKNKTDPINYDGVDYRPEIAVGRWPVTTPAEARLVAAKSVRRDRAARSPERWRARAAAVVVGGWIDARPAMDGVATALSPRLTVEKRYYADAGEKPATAPPTEAEVVALINRGVSFLCHAGHGSDDAWDQCLSVASLARMDNEGRLPVLMSVGCSTARFAVLPPYEPYVDEAGVEHRGTNAGQVFTGPPPPPAAYQRGAFNRTGLGERLLRDGPGGAVAYIGCNTGSQPCALTLLEGFATALGAPGERRLGDCWKAAVLHYVAAQKLPELVPNDDWYPPSIYFQGMKFMLFGDPTLRM